MTDKEINGGGRFIELEAGERKPFHWAHHKMEKMVKFRVD